MLAVRAALVLAMSQLLTAQDDPLLADLQSRDPRRVTAAIAALCAAPDGGLSLLPRVLEIVRDGHADGSLPFAVQRAVAGLGAAALPTMRAALQREPLQRSMLQIAGFALPALLCEPELIIAAARSDSQTAWELARLLAERARDGDAAAPCAFVDLVAAVKVDWKGNVLAAARQAEGDWLLPLYPQLRPLLRTTLAGRILELFAGQHTQLPALIEDVRERLQHGNDEERNQLAWGLAYQPDLARQLVPELLTALQPSRNNGAISCLRALASAGVADPAVRQAVLARFDDPWPETVVEAIGTAATLGLAGDDLQAALQQLAAAKATSMPRHAARMLLWALDPSQGQAPRPDDLRDQDELRPMLVAAVLACARTPPGPEFGAPLVAAVNRGQLPIARRALAALRRMQPAAVELPQLEAQLRTNTQLAGILQQALLQMGEPGLIVLGRALVSAFDPAPLAQCLLAEGDAATPALVAAAGALVLRNRFGLPPKAWLLALPEQLRHDLQEPIGYLLAVGGDRDRPATQRAAALRQLAELQIQDSNGPIFDLAIGCLDSDEVVLRTAALQLLRKLGLAERTRLEKVWLQGDRAQRQFAGAMLRSLDPAMPSLPPWLAQACLQGDDGLRTLAALALAQVGKPAAAAARLAELPAQAGDAGSLLQALAQCQGDLRAGAAAAVPFANGLREELRRPAIEVLRAAGVGELQALTFAACRQLWCADVRGWTRELAEAALAQLASLPSAERLHVVHALARLPATALPARPALAAAAQAVWNDADSWTERAQLVPSLLQLGLSLQFTRADALRMADDPRDEVCRGGVLLGLALGEASVQQVLATRFPAMPVADRLALLQNLAARSALPQWLTCADVLALQPAPPATVLQLLERWQPTGTATERQQLADWLLAVVSAESAAAIAQLLWRLDVPLQPLLVLGEPPNATLRRDPHLLAAFGRQQPRYLLSLLPRLHGDDVRLLLRAVGEGHEPGLLQPLVALLREVETQAAAVSALRCAGDAGLQAVLTLPDAELARPEVLQALGDWGAAGSAAIKRLVHLARDPALAPQVVEALGCLGSPGMFALEELGREGVFVSRPLFAALYLDDDDLVVAALRTLVALRPDGAGPRVAGLHLEQRSARLRRWHAAVDAELNGKPPAAGAELLAGLSADEPQLRMQALGALLRLDPPPRFHRALLVEALEDPDADARLFAATQLVGDPAAQLAAVAIQERLQVETDERVRQVLQSLCPR